MSPEPLPSGNNSLCFLLAKRFFVYGILLEERLLGFFQICTNKNAVVVFDSVFVFLDVRDND